MARDWHDKLLSEEGAFWFEESASNSEPSPTDEPAAELHIMFEDEQRQQTGQVYHLTGTARIDGTQVVSDTMTTAETAQGDPVGRGFAAYVA